MLAFLLLILPSDTIPATPYWQQRVAYEITASLDEPSGVLSGKVRIRYVNQSPDTLHDFNVHQYLNAFRPGSRWSAADSAEQRERFQHMKDPDYAFERITASTVMGERGARKVHVVRSLKVISPPLSATSTGGTTQEAAQSL